MLVPSDIPLPTTSVGSWNFWMLFSLHTHIMNPFLESFFALQHTARELSQEPHLRLKGFVALCRAQVYLDSLARLNSKNRQMHTATASNRLLALGSVHCGGHISLASNLEGREADWRAGRDARCQQDGCQLDIETTLQMTA